MRITKQLILIFYLLVFSSPVVLAQPNITNVTIPNSAMIVGDVVTATITVDDDGGSTYTLTSGAIAGINLTSVSRQNSTTYFGYFTILDNGTDYASSADIPVANLVLDDSGTPGNTYAANISQASDPIDANLPNITNVTIPNSAMKVGDVVTATITVDDDGGDEPTLTSGTIAGISLGSFVRTNATTYTVQFTIADGGTDYTAGTDIPVANLVLTDAAGNPGNTYAANISQAGDPIDANLPNITNVTIPNSAMKVGDVVTATITVDDDGGDEPTLTSGTIAGISLGSFVRTNATTYTVQFTIADGGTDYTAGTDIPVANLVLTDAAGNPGNTYAANISQAGDPIDANLPNITNVTIPNSAMIVGDVVTATITVDDDGGDIPSLTSGTIAGISLGSFARTDATTYTVQFTITDGGTDYTAGTDIPVANLVLTDAAGNPGNTYAANISQASDPIDANTPLISSAVANSNTQITVTLSELASAATITKGNDGGFTVTQTGGGPAYVVSSIAPGATDNLVELTVSDMTVSKAYGVTVTYTASGNGTVTDVAGNLLATDATGVETGLWAAPVISGVAIANGNYKIGDNVTVTITADAIGYTDGTITINGHVVSNFNDELNNTYTCTYTVEEGDDASAVGNIAISVRLVNGAFTSTQYTSSAIGTVTIDATYPLISSAVANSTTQVTVTLSEDVTNLGGSDGGFIVTNSGGPQTYTVSSIAAGAADEIVLTVSNMSSAKSDGVTVTYNAADTDGTVTDAAGNVLATDATGVETGIWAPPIITNAAIANGDYIVGSNVTVTINADDDGYLAGTIEINGHAVTGFFDAGSGTYTCTYTVVEGDDASAVGDITISVILMNGAMPSVEYTSSATGTVTIDATYPIISSAVANSNTQITVTLSEAVANFGTNDGGFIVTKTGGGPTYNVTSIAAGAANEIILTVADMIASKAAGITVTYASGGNGTVTDAAGNDMATDATGVEVVYPPDIETANWQDNNNNGNIDAVELIFDINVDITDGSAVDGFDCIIINDGSVVTIDNADYGFTNNNSLILNFTSDEITGTGISGLTVTYDNSLPDHAINRSSGIFNEEMNDSETPNTYVDEAYPRILSSDLSTSNAFFDITFTEGIYGGPGASLPVDKDDFKMTFRKNPGGAATNVIISNVTRIDTSVAVSGGESILRLHLAIAGTPNGLETIKVNPEDNSIYDAAGNNMNKNLTTGEVYLADELPPVISQVTITSGNYKVGSAIELIINADEPGYTVNTIMINGQDTTSFTDQGGGDYRVVYTVVEGDDDIPTFADVPVYIILKDAGGNPNEAYVNAPVGNAPFTIDANSPKIYTMIPAAGDKKIGDTQGITVITDSPGYTFSTLVVNGIDQASPQVTVTDDLNNNYSIEYDIIEGDADVSSGNLAASVVLTDAAGNSTSSNTLNANTIAIDAHAPVITSMSVVNGTYKVGNNVVLTVNADAAGYVSGAVTINGVSGGQIAFLDVGDNTYEFTYAIAEGDADVISGSLTASVVLTDAAGNPSTAFTAIDPNFLSIDANTPVITSMTVVDGTYKIGDILEVTVVADEAGYTTGPITINEISVPPIVFSDDGGGTYTLTYVILSGNQDVSPGNLTASVVLTDSVGNSNVAYTTIVTNTLAIDANTPVITSMTVVDGTYKVGDYVVLTVNAGAAEYVSGAVTINGVSGAQITFVYVGGGIYEFTYAILEGDADVVSSTLTASVVLMDAAGNPSTAFTAIDPNFLSIDANTPVITSMTVVNGTYKIGDILEVTVVADEAGYTTGPITINEISVPPIVFSDDGGGTYTLTYIILSGNQDVSPGNLTTSVVLTDSVGNSNVAYTTIVANTLAIDANSPVITSMSIVDGTYKVGDNVVITVNSDEPDYIAGPVTINGVSGAQIAFLDAGGGIYQFTYSIVEGDTDVSTGTLSASVVLVDTAGNSNTAFTSVDANTLSIDANTPVITSMSVVNGTYKVGDDIVLTVNADAPGYVSGAVTINGVSGAQITFSNIGGGTYRFTYAIAEGDTDVSSGSLTASVVLTDAIGNSNAAFTIIDVNALSLDANSPVVFSVTIPDTIMRVSDIIVVTLNVSDDGGDVLVLVSGKIGGFNLDPGSLNRINSTTYQTTFVITNGSNDIEPSADIPAEDIVMIDNAGNTNTPFNTFISQASDPIYANLPTAFITGSSIICLYDSVRISVGLEGRDPWTITYSDGATSQALSNINSSPFFFYVNPGQTSTYSITNVEDSTGNINNGSGTFEITVNDLPVVEIIGLNSNYNFKEDSVALYGNPIGGNFFGPGVYDFRKIFNPEDAGLGVHNIIYKYTDVNFCINYDTVEVTVIDAEGKITSLSGNDEFIYCYDGVIDTLQGSSVGGEPGGKFSGDGVDSIGIDLAIFNPALAGSGSHQIFYTYIKDSVPLDIIETFTVDSIGDIDFFGLDQKYCINNETVDLTPILPTDGGGSGTMAFSGPTIISGDIFNPGNAVIGVNTVTLTYTRDYSGCKNLLNRPVQIYDVPHLDFAISDGCVNERDSTGFFNLTSSIDPVITWKWDFDDPASLDENTSDQKTPKHQYPGFGRRSVQLIVITDKICSDTLVRDIDFEEKPLAGFEWENECYSENKSIPFKDKTFSNSPITNYLWKFYDTNGTDTLATYNTTDTDFVFPTQSDYTIELIVNTANGCTDTINHIIQLRPTIRLVDEFYFEDFESGSQGWIPEATDFLTNSWEFGLPSNDIINSAASGNTAWVTDLDGNHFDGEDSWITSPCFDFREMNRPMIKMNILINSEGDRDGAVLQSSTNNGIDWNRVGEYGDGKGLSWFNSVGILGNPGGQQQGWSGTGNNDWQEVRHDLDPLIGLNGVQFRVAFGAGAEGNMEGFAFDNVWIGERTRKVILEHFTNTVDPQSEKADNTVNAIANKDTLGVIDIQYHTNFPGSDVLNEYYPAGPGARAIYYGISDVPYSVMDGWEYFEGFDDQDNYLWKESSLIKRSLNDPQVQINLDAKILNGTTLSIDVIVDTLKSVPSNHEVTLHIAVLENQVEAGDKTYENVIRKMLPDPSGTPITTGLSQGSVSITESWSFNASEIDPAELIVVAFVQDEETGEIFQAASVNYDVITGITSPVSGIGELSFNVYPNPSSGKTYLLFSKPLQEDYSLMIFNNLGAMIENKVLRKGVQYNVLDTENYQNGIYFIRITKDNKTIGIKRLSIIH